MNETGDKTLKVQKWLERKENKSVLIIIVMILFFCLRFINLDSDLPNWTIAEYTPLDEGFYAMQAFDNLDQESVKRVENLTSGEYRRWNSSVSFLNTVFCTITLQIFGNNYYGLRSSSVFAALIVFTLILFIARREQVKEKYKALLVLGLLMLSDFAFLLAGRIVEPSIYRMLIITVMVYIYWVGCKKGNPNYFLLGIFSVLSFLWGYITNVFVLIPCGISILLETYFWKKSFVKTVSRYALGMCLGYVIGEILYFFVQDRFFFQDMKRVIFEREIQRVAISIESMIYNLKSFLQGNMFSYSSLFFVISVLAVLYCFITGLKQKERFKIFISILVIAFTMQSIFTSDFLIRKSIVVYPILLLNILYLIKECKKIEVWYSGIERKNRICTQFFVLCISLLAGILSLTRIQSIPSEQMPEKIKVLMAVSNIIFLLFFLSLCFIRKYNTSKSYAIIVLFLIIPNLIMSYFYIVDMDKSQKQTMEELQGLVGEQYVLGMSHAYRLYNDMIPASSGYDYYYEEDYFQRACELVKREDVIYYVGGAVGDMTNSWLDQEAYFWALVKQFSTDGASGKAYPIDVYVYEKVKIVE